VILLCGVHEIWLGPILNDTFTLLKALLAFLDLISAEVQHRHLDLVELLFEDILVDNLVDLE
jgi:hypothetical protein